LLGNLVGDAELRAQAGRGAALATRLADALPLPTSQPAEDAVLLPLLAALANCLLEVDACAALVASAEPIAKLEALLPHGNPLVAARVTAVLSRLVKLPDGARALLAGEGLAAVTRALLSACKRLASSNDSADPSSELASAACRALAIVVSGGGEAAASRAVQTGCVPALLAAVRCPRVSDAAAGNAALCLSDVARHPSHWPLLRQLDAVAPLVTAAHRRSDKTAQKNASIALARMAQDPACMERLKELHGLEIIYQNVRP